MSRFGQFFVFRLFAFWWGDGLVEFAADVLLAGAGAAVDEGVVVIALQVDAGSRGGVDLAVDAEEVCCAVGCGSAVGGGAFADLAYAAVVCAEEAVRVGFAQKLASVFVAGVHRAGASVPRCMLRR